MPRPLGEKVYWAEKNTIGASRGQEDNPSTVDLVEKFVPFAPPSYLSYPILLKPQKKLKIIRKSLGVWYLSYRHLESQLLQGFCHGLPQSAKLVNTVSLADNTSLLGLAITALLAANLKPLTFLSRKSF